MVTLPERVKPVTPRRDVRRRMQPRAHLRHVAEELLAPVLALFARRESRGRRPGVGLGYSGAKPGSARALRRLRARPRSHGRRPCRRVAGEGSAPSLIATRVMPTLARPVPGAVTRRRPKRGGSAGVRR